MKSYKDQKLRNIGRKFLSISTNSLLIITVGICIYRKAPDIFTEVALNTPEYNFLWIGKYLPLGTIAHSSLLRKKFNTARREQNIRFTGYISSRTLKTLWNAADVFLYVSREENQGIALLESIAYGNVPIVRDHPVFNWLTNEKDCLKGNTVKEFTKQIRKLSNNPDLIRKIKFRGKKTLKAHDMNNTIKKLANLYTEIS